jgi:hypothetical protein
VDLDESRTRLRGEAENPNSQARLRHYDDWPEHLQVRRCEGSFNNSLFESAQGTARFEGTLFNADTGGNS